MDGPLFLHRRFRQLKGLDLNLLLVATIPRDAIGRDGTGRSQHQCPLLRHKIQIWPRPERRLWAEDVQTSTARYCL